MRARVRGPVGDPLTATYARRGTVAMIELAAAAGLGVLPGGRRRPLDASTRGLGELVAHALDQGAERIVVGLGGSAGTDGGAGLLVGLGARVLDAAGHPVASGGRGLADAARIDLADLHPGARAAAIEFAGDVDNPLLGADGAAAVYGPQKGADPEQVRFLDAALGRWAALLHATTGCDVTALVGAGAAGGALCGAAAVLGATRRRGVHTVLELVDFDARVRGADLVVTGEGRLDHQTLQGKAPAGVVEAARRVGAPVVAVAGDSTLAEADARAAGFEAVHTLVALAADRDEALRDAARLLHRAGRTIAGAPSDDQPLPTRARLAGA